MLSDIITGLVLKEHGAMVAEQFMCTFNEQEDFEEQNYNALGYIETIVDNVILSCDCLSNDAIGELMTYTRRLKEHLYK